MGASFIFQTAANIYSAGTEEAPVKQSKTSFSHTDLAQREQQDGGPRRYYEDGELDIASARVADEHGNPVEQLGKHDGRTYTHINVAYCIS